MKTEYDDLTKFLAIQFPATVGNVELRRLIDNLELSAYRAGMTEAADTVIMETAEHTRASLLWALRTKILKARDAKTTI